MYSKKKRRTVSKCSWKSLEKLVTLFGFVLKAVITEKDIKRGMNEQKIIFYDNYNLV